VCVVRGIVLVVNAITALLEEEDDDFFLCVCVCVCVCGVRVERKEG